MTSARDQRIVVTGLGATTPLGGTITDTWEGILAGRSGARTIDADWVTKYELPVTFAAQLAVPPSEVLARHQIKRLDPSSQYALIASRAAWEDAGKPEIDPERLGVVMGSGIGGVWTLLDQWDVPPREGPAPGLPARRARCSCPTVPRRRSPSTSAPGRARIPPSVPAPPAPRAWRMRPR